MKHFEILRDENGKFFAVKVTGKAYFIFNILIVVIASLTYIIMTWGGNDERAKFKAAFGASRKDCKYS